MSGPAVLEISVSEFKAKCLRLFKDLEAHRLEKVVVTRRGKPVAELRPPAAEPLPPLYGCMKERTFIPPDLDLTEPILEDIPEAEAGHELP
jgi:antitoxin (DNA-binding transcriptional repressor) of toxin-antitoxin stability system